MHVLRSNGKVHKVLMTGLPHFSKRIASLIADEHWHVTVLTPQSYKGVRRRSFERAKLLARLAFFDVVYQIGGPTVDDRLLQVFSGLRRPIVLHWVGSDVCEARSNPKVLAQYDTRTITNWADAPWLKSELREVGIEAAIMPSSAVGIQSLSALPNGPLAVLLYLPDTRWDFYRGSTLVQLAADLPTINFCVVGSSGVGRPRPPNLRYLGWVSDLEAVYRQSHVLLRLPAHDGLSAMVIESLARGRHVIWNYPQPGVRSAATIEEARARLIELERAQENDELELNQIGHDFVQAEFDQSKVAREIKYGFAVVLRRRFERTRVGSTP